jgi:hypothetical protein
LRDCPAEKTQDAAYFVFSPTGVTISLFNFSTSTADTNLAPLSLAMSFLIMDVLRHKKTGVENPAGVELMAMTLLTDHHPTG